MRKLLVVLMVVAMATFLFVGCNGNGVVPETCTLTMAVNPTGGGTTVPAVGTHPNYTSGTDVSVIATPATGYEFVNWSGDVDAPNSSSATVTMDSDKTVIANFEEEEDEPTPEPTVAPIITSVPDAADGYVNKAEAANGLVVNGTGPTYSEIRVYISGLTAGTGDVTATGAWTVVVANADLIKIAKTDGPKTLSATAKNPGSLESASSNVVKFTLDTARPTIKKCSAKAGVPAVKFVWAKAKENVPLPFLSALSAGPKVFTAADSAAVVTGTWIVDVTSPIPINNVVITDPNGNKFTYSSWPGDAFGPGSPIPGVSFKLAGPPLKPIMCSQIICTAQVDFVPAVPGYIDVTFNEPVTSASKLAGTWTAFCATWNLMPTVAVTGAEKARLTETAPTIPNLVAGRAYSVSVSGITDLAGNSIPASSPSTCFGIVMP